MFDLNGIIVSIAQHIDNHIRAAVQEAEANLVKDLYSRLATMQDEIEKLRQTSCEPGLDLDSEVFRDAVRDAARLLIQDEVTDAMSLHEREYPHDDFMTKDSDNFTDAIESTFGGYEFREAVKEAVNDEFDVDDLVKDALIEQLPDRVREALSEVEFKVTVS